MAVRMARPQHGGEGLQARGAERDARLDRRPLALGALAQRLQRQADAGQRVAEHHAEDGQHVARRVPGRGADHDRHRIERGEPADQQQRGIAEAVGPASRRKRRSWRCTSSKPATSTITRAMSSGPGGEVCSKHELQHEADRGQLHHHAHGGDGEAALQPQAEGERDGAVDDQQQRRQRQIERRESAASAHAAALSRRARGAAHPRSCSRACARRSICAASWLTSSTMRSASSWNLISSSASAAAVASSARGRLVEQQHARLVGERADEPQALALAGRKLGYRPVEQGGLERQRRRAAARAWRWRKVLARGLAPPRRLGRGVAHAPAPLRARASRAAPRPRECT